MGRKPLPKNERREVISISLKPAVIAATDILRGDESRSRYIEAILEQRANLPVWGIICPTCDFMWELNKMSRHEKTFAIDDTLDFSCPLGCPDTILNVVRVN
jgi:hypothetical protein